MVKDKRVYAVILAAGIGSRMGADITKQKMLLNGRSVIARTVGTFYECDFIEKMVIVGRAEELDYLKTELSPYAEKIHATVVGGATRLDSARRGFLALPSEATHIALHDGARPLVSKATVRAVVECAVKYGAATDAGKIYDTVKRVDGNGIIRATLDRTELAVARTPQVFDVEIYKRALRNAGDGVGITDDNMMVEALGVELHTVVTDEPNPKITVPQDLKYAEFLLNEREAANV